MSDTNPETAIRRTATAYQTIAPAYSRCWSNDPCMQSRLDIFSKYLPENAFIIDIGCGTGRDVKYLVSKNFRAFGIDLSEAMLNEAHKLFSNGSFSMMDMRHLGLSAAICDGVWASASVIHLPKSEVHYALEEISRILKKDGVLFLSMQEGSGERFSEDGRFFVYYKRDEICTLLKQHQFEILEFEPNQSIKNTFKKTLTITWINFLAKKME
jgi:ubiquinone/menaquinone biosynthesis C-methylase UbiE